MQLAGRISKVAKGFPVCRGRNARRLNRTSASCRTAAGLGPDGSLFCTFFCIYAEIYTKFHENAYNQCVFVNFYKKNQILQASHATTGSTKKNRKAARHAMSPTTFSVRLQKPDLSFSSSLSSMFSPTLPGFPESSYAHSMSSRPIRCSSSPILFRLSADGLLEPFT